MIDELKQSINSDDLISNNAYMELAKLFIKRQFPRKHILVRAGDLWCNVYYIHQGVIRLYYTDRDGREFNKDFFCEGRLVWPVAPAARENDSLFSIAALEDIKLSVCPFDSFYTWLNSHNCWETFALPYAEAFAEDKFIREYEFLMHSATERYRRFSAQKPELTERIPDYHLASYLGMTNVSLSRIKTKLKIR